MTLVRIDETGGLGPIQVEVSIGGGTVTPASRTMLRAIGLHRRLLSGTGIDWGSGTGCLAIAAARIEGVDRVVAVERDPSAVASIEDNARRNGVGGRVVPVRADLLEPLDPPAEQVLERLRGAAGFLVGNPPASVGDDGLGFRRRVLSGARPLLVPDAPVVLQVSAQYGARIPLLGATGYRYEGVLETSPLVPFDLDRADLMTALVGYAEEEHRTGEPYDFRVPGSDRPVTAAEALRRRHESGASPLSRWQAHLFRRRP